MRMYSKIKNWSEIPYPNRKEIPKAMDYNTRYWIMNYFKYVGNTVFTNNNGRVIIWNIENPKDINFKEDLKEIEYIQKSNTELEIAMAEYWGEKSPIEIILPIAIELVSQYKVSSSVSARIMSILTKAINDAFIITSHFKYFWNRPRPVQLEENLKTILETPSSPTYPSIYAVVTAVSMEIISYYFPTEKDKLLQLKQQASISRLYAGVHFKSDLSQGIRLGNQIAKLIIEEISRDRDIKGMNIDSPVEKFLDVEITPKYI